MASCFQRIASSDDSDQSDGEDCKSFSVLSKNEPSASDNDVAHDEGNPGEPVAQVKASNKLAIVENRKNLNKKFSIWSEILMEEELNESMNNALKLKRRRQKHRKGEKDSDNYSFWTKEDFERKFATKKTNDEKKKLKRRQLKKDAVSEISRQLKESRVDIIRRIVQVVGEEKARKLAAEVGDIESAGGIMTTDGKRRRSPGGVLFFLVKNEPSISADQKRDIFCDNLVKMNDKQMKKERQNHAKAPSDKKKKKKKSKKKNKKN